MGKKLGQADDPLLVSVRSGARFSMPGMMETVLNIGLNDESVHGLAEQAGDDRFAWDSYRRLIQMFGKTVQDIDGELFEDAIEEAKRAKGITNDLELDAADFRSLVEVFKDIVAEQTGHPFPTDPRGQMDLAIKAVFESWNAPRAVLYRRQERIPPEAGTAVNVCSMVFGNMGMDSGTGVAFTRDPASGQQGVYGDYLQNAQGEDVVAGIRNTVPLGDLEQIDKKSYGELQSIMEKLENHYRDLCDIEFTIERGKLWMLQTRVGKRTAAAAFRIADQLVDQGMITLSEAVGRVTGDQLAQLMFPRFDERAERHFLGRGMNASPGAAVGRAVFDSYTAIKWSRSGESVILCRRETNPDDLEGMIAAQGILTSRGGKTSHAAVVARGMGKTCVCGAEEFDIDTKNRRLAAPGGEVINEGDVVSIDGTSGRSSSARCRSSPRRSCATSKARSTPPPPRPTTWYARCTASCASSTPPAGWRCGPTPTPPTTPRAPAGWEPRGSGCAVPSTCSSATAGSSSSASSSPIPRRSRRSPFPRCCRCSARTSSASSVRWRGCP